MPLSSRSAPLRLRLTMAWHVLRGRPILYGVTFLAPPQVSTSNADLFVGRITVKGSNRP